MITARPPANEFPASVAIEALGLVRARANDWASKDGAACIVAGELTRKMKNVKGS